jgi:hypothetical protein
MNFEMMESKDKNCENKIVVEGPSTECDNNNDDYEEDVEEDYDEDEYIKQRHERIERKQNLLKILTKHKIDDLLKEKILEDYFLSMV